MPVNGATARQLVEAIKRHDEAQVRAMLQAQPELARLGIDNFGVIHHAVLTRQPALVRLLMDLGANARDGIYPYRDATTAHAIAVQRGYDDIVRIIEEAERTRPGGTTGMGPDPTPLHHAAHACDAAQVEGLLDAGADPNARMHQGLTPLDVAARRWWQADTPRFEETARRLLARGASLTARAAAALGDIEWLRRRHAETGLKDASDGRDELLRISVTHDRAAVFALLLDLGFDPDNRIPLSEDDGPPFSWGMPLQHAAQLQRYEMAEALLERGADPNAEIYASGTPLTAAHAAGDQKMVALLERYGGKLSGNFTSEYGTRDEVEKTLEDDPEQAMASALVTGDVDVLRRALAHITWPRDDPRWFNLLEECPRHGRPGHVDCLRVLLERVDPNLRGRSTDNQQFGLTTLHNVVARGDRTPAERVAMAAVLLDAGARLDLRDYILRSTPLGWACRWGHAPLVAFFLERGGDPVEKDAEPWARPRAWAERMNRRDVLALLP